MTSQGVLAKPTKNLTFANPYLMGVALGLVLLASFLVMGKGLGASGAAHRLGVAAVDAVAPAHVAASEYLSQTTANGANPLDDSFVFMLLGVFLGALVASYAAGRFGKEIVRGPRISTKHRLIAAAIGGVMMGFAAKLTLGCTSGQALSGGALMSAGSWIFMLAVFAGGYGMAYFVRRQWT
jgi:hypothetical protein